MVPNTSFIQLKFMKQLYVAGHFAGRSNILWAQQIRLLPSRADIPMSEPDDQEIQKINTQTS